MGIEIVRGYGLITDEAQVLVCTTNSVGAMGAGVAKVFREQIPKLYYRYRKHCQEHNPADMVPYVFERGESKFVYCLHTKRQWWFRSKMEYIEKGLADFVVWCIEQKVTSVALPPLGCGNGGFTFDEIEPVMRRHLEGLDADVRIYVV